MEIEEQNQYVQLTNIMKKIIIFLLLLAFYKIKKLINCLFKKYALFIRSECKNNVNKIMM